MSLIANQFTKDNNDSRNCSSEFKIFNRSIVDYSSKVKPSKTFKSILKR